MKSVLVAAIVLFLLSIWIVVPAPVLLLLPLAVVVPEFSPILLILTLVVGGLTLLTRKSRIKRAALSLAVMTLAICTVPLVRVALATPTFDRALALDEEPHAHLLLPVVLGGLVPWPRRWRRACGSPVSSLRPARRSSSDTHNLSADIPGRFPILVQIYGGAWQRGTPNDDSLFARGNLRCARSRRVRDRLSARATLEWRANSGCSGAALDCTHAAETTAPHESCCWAAPPARSRRSSRHTKALRPMSRVS